MISHDVMRLLRILVDNRETIADTDVRDFAEVVSAIMPRLVSGEAPPEVEAEILHGLQILLG